MLFGIAVVEAECKSRRNVFEVVRQDNDRTISILNLPAKYCLSTNVIIEVGSPFTDEDYSC